MAVHFKFRSAVAFDSISVEGNGITVSNLKDKIIELKNLGRSTNFDLIITNADSGEEYTEDNALVPKNTSVIIKRIPARRPTTRLLVNEPDDDVVEQKPSLSANKVTDVSQLALTSPIDDLYDMDDFGIDLYAVDESALTHVEADETCDSTAILTKSKVEQRRLTQGVSGVVHEHGREEAVKGLAEGPTYRTVPHTGYICHRCGLPGNDSFYI